MTEQGQQRTSDELPRLGKQLLRRTRRVVDLTQEIYEGMPIYGFHQRPFIFVNNTHQEALDRGANIPFSSHNLLISEHTGTHADAIYEYDENGPTLERTPLEFYYGEAICLDVSHVRYPTVLTPEVLEAALAASGQEIRPGDIVLLHTGHFARTYPGPDFLRNYTGLDRAGAVWLAEQGVVNIGIDQVAIDHCDDDGIAHIVCKEYQIVNTEGLRNLDQVVNLRFEFYGLPLLIRAGTGSPIRAIAVIDSA